MSRRAVHENKCLLCSGIKPETTRQHNIYECLQFDPHKSIFCSFYFLLIHKHLKHLKILSDIIPTEECSRVFLSNMANSSVLCTMLYFILFHHLQTHVSIVLILQDFTTHQVQVSDLSYIQVSQAYMGPSSPALYHVRRAACENKHLPCSGIKPKTTR